VPFDRDPPDPRRTFAFATDIRRADVYFLIDTTGSMGSPIANVQSSLTRISTELSARIDDLQMGVGHFEDFPNEPDCGFFDFDCISGSAYGAAGDVAYANLQDITDSVSAVQTALNSLELGNGADGPESQIEALYQTATGEGGSWTFDSGASHSIPPRTCPTIPDEVGTRRGYPCFRPGALPIIVLVSDVTFHNGPASGNGYAGIAPPPHSSAHATDAVAALGARVVGVAIGGGGRNDQEALARASGTVDGTGRPLVYDSAGGEVSDAIIEGITTLVGGTPQDVTTATENVAGNPGGVDARDFIVSITPVEGFRDGIAGTGYASKDTTTFYEVVPGTLVDFAVDFHNDFVPPAETAVIFRAVIVVMGNGVARLDERQVYIIVPPEGAVILI
jgi:hypothetical protein